VPEIRPNRTGREGVAMAAGRRGISLVENCEHALVGVIHEYDLLRRGIASCLADDPQVSVVFAVAEGVAPADVDVLVVSPLALENGTYKCPVVVCVDGATPLRSDGSVAAVVPWPTLTPAQLVASVRAAAAGFRLSLDGGPEGDEAVDPRWIEVLRLLAEGASTRQISEQLYYSERTVKSLIHDLGSGLRAHTRAQAVAEALRRGLI